MAEFTEIIRQGARMCRAQNECTSCPALRIFDPSKWCPFYAWREYLNRLSDTENAVSAWAAEHPEPRYPTWREWHEATFPNVNHSIVCPKVFGAVTEDKCIKIKCENCRESPIPADIAEKLGIQPIGAE